MMKNVFLLFLLTLSAYTLSAQCVFTDAGELADYEALMALYNATDGPNWTDNTGWANGAEPSDCFPCDNAPVAWKGVTCSGGRVTAIQLRFNNLNGAIPAELSNLTHLIALNLSNNSLAGEIPSSLGGLSNLSILNLGGNDLTGEIPSSLESLSNLSTLSLNGNDLTGEIPSFLGALSNLNSLNLAANNLAGGIPSSLGALSNLNSLSLNGNSLTGEIPSSLGFLSNLSFLSLNGNGLTGEIPSSLGSLSDLRVLNLGSNGLAGCIPQSLCTLLDNDVEINLANNPGLPGGGSSTALEEFCTTGSVGAEICGDGIDNNCDGLADEGCCALVLGCKETYTVALPISGSITVEASELDENSSGCGLLAYAISGFSSLTLGCGDIGAQEVELTIADGEGNIGNCTIEVALEDHNPDADADGTSDACDDAFSLDTKIASLAGYINTLGFTGGQGNGLIIKLQQVLDKYCKGKLNGALNRLSSFVSQVQSLEAEGVLSATEAAELIAGADALAGAISSGTAIDGCPAQNLAAPADGSSQTAASAVGLQLFPNPVRRQVHFTIQAPEDSSAQARVYNLQGELLLTRSLSLNQGFYTDYLEVASFQDGLYLLEVQFGEERLQRRFVVQK